MDSDIDFAIRYFHKRNLDKTKIYYRIATAGISGERLRKRIEKVIYDYDKEEIMN